MFIKLKEKNGKKLKTAGTACAEDINIIPVLQEKKVDGNGTYTADDGYVGISKIIVDVESEPSIPEGYVKPSGTKQVTTNETHDVKEFEFVEVAVPTEGGEIMNEPYIVSTMADLPTEGDLSGSIAIVLMGR